MFHLSVFSVAAFVTCGADVALGVKRADVQAEIDVLRKRLQVLVATKEDKGELSGWTW